MKRITALFLIMIFTLSSCGGEESRIEELESQVSALQEQVGGEESVISYAEDSAAYIANLKEIIIESGMLTKEDVMNSLEINDGVLEISITLTEEEFFMEKFNAADIYYMLGEKLLGKLDWNTLTVTFEGLGVISMNRSQAVQAAGGEEQAYNFLMPDINKVIETWGMVEGADKTYTFNNMSVTVDSRYEVVLDENGILQIIFEKDKEFVYINLSKSEELSDDMIDITLVLFAANYIKSFEGSDINYVEVPLQITNPSIASTFTHKLNFKTVTAHLIIVYDGQDFYYIHYIYDVNGEYAHEISKILESIIFNA